MLLHRCVCILTGRDRENAVRNCARDAFTGGVCADPAATVSVVGPEDGASDSIQSGDEVRVEIVDGRRGTRSHCVVQVSLDADR